ncbi:ATP-binding cassette domain-containing protein, partial [Lacisediminihabitans profunda]
EILERGTTASVLSHAAHDYTRALLDASPSLDRLRPAEAAHDDTTALLQVPGLGISSVAHAARIDVDVTVGRGEIVAIVGESGSGKSTLARCIAGRESPDVGKLSFSGQLLPPGRRYRRPSQIQIVFQDPYSTLNP